MLHSIRCQWGQFGLERLIGGGNYQAGNGKGELWVDCIIP